MLTEAFVKYVGHPVWLAYKRELGIVYWYWKSKPLWTADQDRLQRMRKSRLTELLKHAGSTTKHYSELFAQLGFDPRSLRSEDDIRQFPFLTKEQLNADMDGFLSNAYRRDQLIRSSTGGSSGVSLTFYRDRRVQSIRRAQDCVFNGKLGIYPGMRRAWVWGSRLDVVSLRSWKARVSNFLTERAIYFYAFDATLANMDAFLAELHRYHPVVVFAYPNMLATLAQRAKETGIPIPPISKVIVTAEPLYDWQRQLNREVFGAETFERYGSREIGTLASECREHRGMHLFEPNYCLEVIDDNGNGVPKGTMGELVVTDLFNYAMPLVRYRTGDMVVLDDAPCGCGCTWRRIVSIGGRVVDMIIRPDGAKVEGLVIVNSLHTSGMRAKVQVVQTSPSELMVRYLGTDSIPDSVRDGFKKRVSELMGAEINVNYEPVSQLRYDPSGKYRYVICECRQDA
jgi:phenylacetate-CoA ligase